MSVYIAVNPPLVKCLVLLNMHCVRFIYSAVTVNAVKVSIVI